MRISIGWNRGRLKGRQFDSPAALTNTLPSALAPEYPQNCDTPEFSHPAMTVNTVLNVRRDPL